MGREGILDCIFNVSLSESLPHSYSKSTLVLCVYTYKAKPLLPVKVPEFIPTLHCKLTIRRISHYFLRQKELPEHPFK